MEPQDKFWFYNSAIGDLTKLIHKYAGSDLTPTPGFITNAFGVKVNPDHFPLILTGLEGTVEPLPIPANWHTDIAEIGGALRAVDLSKDSFTAVELGCGWGCWLNITGVVARRKGLKVKLIGIEGDVGHVDFAHESLSANGFAPDEYTVYHGIASGKEGVALFPTQECSGVSWGLEPLFDVTEEQAENLLKGNNYQKLRQITLDSVFPPGCDRVDLLHMDIQGGEVDLVRGSMDFLNKRVAMMLIGTHSRKIEGDLLDFLIKAGWFCEVERPAVLFVGKSIETHVDGVQLWRNPALISDGEANAIQEGESHIKNHKPAVVIETTEKPETTKTISTFPEWDSFVQEADRLCATDSSKFHQHLAAHTWDIQSFIRQFELTGGEVRQKNPFSEEDYFIRERSFFEFISGKPYDYKSEGYLADVDAIIRNYPLSCYRSFIDYHRNGFCLLDYIQPRVGGKFLELGYGFGNLLELFGRAGCSVSGVDASPSFWEVAYRRCIMQNIKVDRLTYGSFASVEDFQGSYDYIAFDAAFHHCEMPVELLSLLRRKVSSPDARLIFFNEPVADYFDRPWGFVRTDGETAYQIRKRAWFEIGIRTDFFKELLEKTGWRLLDTSSHQFFHPTFIAEPVL